MRQSLKVAGLAGFCACLCAQAPADAAIIVFETNTGTAGVFGGPAASSINGTSFTSALVGGVYEFRFAGDLNLQGDTIALIGDRAARIVVGGNANLQNSSWQANATGAQGTLGGGDGGVSNVAFDDNDLFAARFGGGAGGSRGEGGRGGAPSGSVFQSAEDGQDGGFGFTADRGQDGATGTAGADGASGFNNSGGGAGGSGGEGGAGGLQRSPGVFGAGGDGYSPGDPADDGGAGGDGQDGRAGDGGGDAASGQNGSNSSSSFVLTAGTGGGAGGQGGEGGYGAGGGGGGGGGGEGGGVDLAGNDGGFGGLGGDGGSGTPGGAGGTGGGGGGALEVFALGNLNATGADFNVRGGGGDAGQTSRETAGENGDPVFFDLSRAGELGEAGIGPANPPNPGTSFAPGGFGGNGGDGGVGGRGGGGGAGSGGTVKLVGTSTFFDNTTIDANSGDGSAEGRGRFLLGNNTGQSAAGVTQITSTFVTGSGPADDSPYTQHVFDSPYLTGLVGGPETYGLSEQTLPIFKTLGRNESERAILYLDAVDSPIGGGNQVTLTNASDEDLTATRLGMTTNVGGSYSVGLRTGGIANNALFGGDGVADGLGPFEEGRTFVTTTSDETQRYTAQATFRGETFSGSFVGNGGSLVVTADFLAEADVTETLDFGSVRVGETATATLTIANTAADNGIYTDTLEGAVTGITGGFANTDQFSTGELAAGESDSKTILMNTLFSGVLDGTATVDLTSINNHGINGTVIETGLGSETVALSGKVWQTAIANVLESGLIDFGIVHVGDFVEHALTITNIASGALVDSLGIGFWHSFDGNGEFLALNGLSDLIAAGDTNGSDVRVALDAGTAGLKESTARLILTSENPDMDFDLALGDVQTDFVLKGQVNNYANAAFGLLGGTGALTGGGDSFLLDLGTIERWGGPVQSDLTLFNDVMGFADMLGGTFDISGGLAGFDFLGFDAFSGLGAGDGNLMSLLFNGGSLSEGFYSFDVTFSGRGSNASGYDEVINPVTLTVQMFVDQVPTPGALILLSVGLAGLARMRRPNQKIKRWE